MFGTYGISKDNPKDMEEILNDTITAQELEVSTISQFFFILLTFLFLIVILIYDS